MVFATGADTAAAATAKLCGAAAGAARCGRFGCASATDAHVSGIASLLFGGSIPNNCACGAHPGSAPGSAVSAIDSGRWRAGMGRAGSDASAAKKLKD